MKKRLSTWALIVVGIQMIPLLLRAPWTFGDYVFATVVLFGSASLFEYTTRNMRDTSHRIIVGIAVLTVVIFIWGLAVADP
jgi:hypothetical protein